MKHYKTLRSIAIVGALLHMVSCKKANVSNEVNNYNATYLPDIRVKQYEMKQFTDSIHIEDRTGNNTPITVALRNLPAGMYAVPSSVSGTPPLDVVFTIHSRPVSSGALRACVNITNSAAQIQSIAFNVNVASTGTPCVDKMLGSYTGTDACTPTYGSSGYDVSVFTLSPESGIVFIGLPFGTVQARVSCNDSCSLIQYNNGSISVTGKGTYDGDNVQLIYNMVGSVSTNCTTTLHRKPY